MRLCEHDGTVGMRSFAVAVPAGIVSALGAFLVLASCGTDDSRSAPGPDAEAPTATPDAAEPERDAGPVPAPFGLDVRPPNATCKPPARPPLGTSVAFEERYSPRVLSVAPMMMAQPPGDGSRWFVAARDGRLFSFASDDSGPTTEVTKLSTVTGLTIQTGGEGGFLGFAFHPKFAQNGRVYVSFTSADGPTGYHSRVGYITSPDNGVTFTSYKNILDFDQPNTNHNGGGIAFGRDGMLYLSFGDGGGGFEHNGQVKTGFFSKIVRIDVDKVPAGKTYGIPADNPFATATDTEPATFAYGFRNPFRFSIDRETGDVWVGDVGHALWEEINLAKAGGNYGWPCREALADYWGQHPTFCPLGTTNLVDPVVTVHHDAASPSRSITGGVVYRGKAIPNLVGTYVYGDFSGKEVWGLSFDPITGESRTPVLNPSGPLGGWVNFAEDDDGEIFALDLFGYIYKLVPPPPDADAGAPNAGPLPAARLSQTGCVMPDDPKRPATGLVPFGVNAELWSDGADKERYVALPDGATMSVGTDGDIDLPPGSVLMKSFWVQGQRVETRLLTRGFDGTWARYSYEWLPDGSDAVLLPSSKRKEVGSTEWFYPSRADCMRCHTEAAGRSLGLELGQLERPFVYASTNRVSPQLATLEHIGMFASPLPPVSPSSVLPSIGSNAPVDAKARAYLHANCAACHRPSGGAIGDMDLRYSVSLADTKACGAVASRGDFGIAGAKLIVPGEPSLSLVSLRAHALGSGRMPPLGSAVVDTQGLGVVDAWIDSLQACP